MEYLLRLPRDLVRPNHHSDVSPSSPSLPPRNPGSLHHRLLLAAAVLTLLAQALVLALFHSQPLGRLLSNILQLVLGMAAFFAMLDAGRRSRRTARWVWYYAAAAVATYTAGQSILIGYLCFGHGPLFAPRISDQFFFFWVVPLLAAVALARLRRQDGFDLTALFDFSQFVILAVALHVWVFGKPSQWMNHPQEMEFLKVKVRLARDAVVLGWLWGCAWLVPSRQLRGLFVRLGAFYLIYSLADAVYLYVEAAWQVHPGTWFDLLWSLPRASAVVLALNWEWRKELEARAPVHRRALSMKMAAVIVPLAILAICFRTLSYTPLISATLVVASLVMAGIGLTVMQSRQERTLDELHSSNELLHSIIEGASEAIYLKDREGRFKLINSAGARHFGRDPRDIVGKTAKDLVSPDALATIERMDQEVLSEGKSVTSELSLARNGVIHTFLSTKNPYRDSHGHITGVVGIALEITERRHVEEQLRRAQRMDSVGAFSGAIAHDFSNVLTVIKGYSQLSQATMENHSAIRGNLEEIVKATDRAAALVRQLLAFSRQQVLQPRVISLNDIVSHLHRMLQRLIGNDVEITARLADDLWAVKADPGQMEQVLMNLAANARDAMPRGGKLILETINTRLDDTFAHSHAHVQAGDYAMLAVTDTGIGMDGQTLVRVFEPFFTTKPAGQGTGLGLSTVYGIVKQSGGYVSVDSALGAGATFKLYLPRVDQPIEYHIEGPVNPA